RPMGRGRRLRGGDGTDRDELINGAPMFACVYAPPAPVCHPLAESRTREALLALAQMFVPRFEVPRDDLVLLDVRGLGRILGEPRQIGAELRKAAADRGLPVHVAI